jgi:hypothetical protein
MSVVLLAGCYEYIPASGTPPVGSPIAVDVTDVGRVALGGAMGPEIDRIEGRLVEQGSDAYRLKVTSVTLLHGGTQPWSGEAITLQPSYVGRVYTQRLDKVKTGLGIGLAIGGVVAIAAQQLGGVGTKEGPNEGRPDTLQTNRVPRVRFPVLSFKF